MTGSAAIFSSNSSPDGDPLTRITAFASHLLSSGNLLNVHARSFPSVISFVLVATPMNCPYGHLMSSLFPLSYFVMSWTQYFLSELNHGSVRGRPSLLLHRGLAILIHREHVVCCRMVHWSVLQLHLCSSSCKLPVHRFDWTLLVALGHDLPVMLRSVVAQCSHVEVTTIQFGFLDFGFLDFGFLDFCILDFCIFVFLYFCIFVFWDSQPPNHPTTEPPNTQRNHPTPEPTTHPTQHRPNTAGEGSTTKRRRREAPP